jgi:hypothetical protein
MTEKLIFHMHVCTHSDGSEQNELCLFVTQVELHGALNEGKLLLQKSLAGANQTLQRLWLGPGLAGDVDSFVTFPVGVNLKRNRFLPVIKFEK